MEETKTFADYNAQPVLERLEAMIKEGRSRLIEDVYNELSIFDWWPEILTITHMKQMRIFLREAIKLGYTGYVCFKVGATGCANGMWAFVNETTTGYSPDGDALYRSFTPAYTYWSFEQDNKWYPETIGKKHNSLKTIKMLEELLEEIKLLGGK